MDFYTLAGNRYSVRRFSKKSVEPEKLTRILEAARLAPTACNNQPQRILVLQSPESLLKCKKCTPNLFGAPLALLICYDRGASWKRSYDGMDSGEMDAAIVATHILFEAAELGLGSTYAAFFDPAAFRREFSLPENLEPAVFLPIGYPAEDAAPAPLHNSRKPLSETVFYEHF